VGNTEAAAPSLLSGEWTATRSDYDLFDDAEEELALRPWSNDRPLNTLSGGEQGDPLAGADPLILGKRSSKGGADSAKSSRKSVAAPRKGSKNNSPEADLLTKPPAAALLSSPRSK
jgi:hypothetical protein